MPPAARTALTLSGLVVACALAGLFGLKALTEPFPERKPAPICVPTEILAGGELFPGQVTVSVLNASKREGLASRTLGDLTSAGFSQGQTGNVPDGFVVDNATVISDEPDNPAVQLVLSHLPAGSVVTPASPTGLGIAEPGVIVAVGENFTEVQAGQDSVVSTITTRYCSPPVN